MPPLQPRAAPVVAAPVVERLPPELPPEDRWWANPGPAIVAGILGLVVGGLLGYAIGGKGETVSETQRGGGTAITHTVTRTNTVVQPKVEVHTNTVTTTAPASTPAPSGSEGEERRHEAEEDRRRVERENAELKRQLEETDVAARARYTRAAACPIQIRRISAARRIAVSPGRRSATSPTAHTGSIPRTEPVRNASPEAITRSTVSACS